MNVRSWRTSVQRTRNVSTPLVVMSAENVDIEGNESAAGAAVMYDICLLLKQMTTHMLYNSRNNELITENKKDYGE